MSDSGGKIGWFTAASLVVANMVGTGAFTSLGLQLSEVQSTWSIIALWVLGAIISLFGALNYAELCTHIPRSGGEYRVLSELMHPMVGYLSGWVSLTVGFAAAVALAAMAMDAYLERFFPLFPGSLALVVILLMSGLHSLSLQHSSLLQRSFTVLKVLLLAVLILAGLSLPSPDHSLDWSPAWKEEWLQPGFAVALVYTLYAFSGWNAAAYVVEEIRSPERNLPRALVGGTLFVGLLYLLLQLAFLRQATPSELMGKVEIGQVVARDMFGPAGGRWLSFFIALLLVSSISAMIWVGPRVVRAMAADYPLWSFLARDNRNGLPVGAIWFQSGISIALILTSSFEKVLVYSGFVLQLSTTLAVASVLYLRYRRPDLTGYRSPFFPLPAVLFLLASTWILIYLLIDRLEESLLGLLNLLVGALIYAVDIYLLKNGRQIRSKKNRNGKNPLRR